ncbi:lytic polysaccharide monooxygenase [Saccharata proteae CBS 121410]|uniref:Lytic polysaccharide monooxygenase n=1 Tax=Saccharata proteae CBS 121410 TaxID=1314787 RepID=A0A9P4HSF8_9PEZI|nr:lytic polysaccharide monooxygenase [Saccharata proteae CBS 121410]
MQFQNNMKLTTIAAILGNLALSANAHMIMAQPVPYGVDTLNNSPLSGSADFPCKQRTGVYKVSKMNEMAVGKEQPLSFKGSAIHGGGSCQISVSMDKEPTAKSVFKVIHSIEGGCPGVDSPETFNFKIPDGFPNGEFALAWTWFNKIGNREMYMNCAPITVTGGSSDTKVFDALPDMFVANVPGTTTCKTPDSANAIFPNPGDSVETTSAGQWATMATIAGCAQSTAAAKASSPATPTASSTPAAVSSSPVSSTAVMSTPSTLSTTPGPYSNSTGTTTSTTFTCSTDGAFLCNGLNQWGLCDHGKVVWQAVASGTKCENGQIMKRHLRVAGRVDVY